MMQEKYTNQLKMFREITALTFQEHHAARFDFCKYESMCSATETEILCVCFSRNFVKF